MRSPWRPMSAAPKDTMILVTETPNGEHYNVMPACWMAYGRENDPDNEKHGAWHGVDVSRFTPSEGPLFVRFKAIVLTPLCWMPYPEPEPVAKLRRRAGQIYREKKTHDHP